MKKSEIHTFGVFFYGFIPHNLTLTAFLLSSEVTPTSGRGAGGLCSSTLEKLKGFTCSAEPSVGFGDARREEKKTDGAGSKICDQASGDKNRFRQPEEEHEEDDKEEEEEVKEKESPGLAATKQVPRYFKCSLHRHQSVFCAGGWPEDEGLSQASTLLKCP